VIKYKKLFYNASYANYDDCVGSHSVSSLYLEALLLTHWKRTFQQMLESGMFYGTPSFDEIIKDVRELEALINIGGAVAPINKERMTTKVMKPTAAPFSL